MDSLCVSSCDFYLNQELSKYIYKKILRRLVMLDACMRHMNDVDEDFVRVVFFFFTCFAFLSVSETDFNT